MYGIRKENLVVIFVHKSKCFVSVFLAFQNGSLAVSLVNGFKDEQFARDGKIGAEFLLVHG